MTYTIYDPAGAPDFVASDDETYLGGSTIDRAVQFACMAMSSSDYYDVFYAEHGFDPADDENIDDHFLQFYAFCESSEVVEAFRTAISEMVSGDSIQLYCVTIEAK